LILAVLEDLELDNLERTVMYVFVGIQIWVSQDHHGFGLHKIDHPLSKQGTLKPVAFPKLH
jgi:hypothetical protein